MAERVLEGKVVMLTGAGRGLGLSMAIGLAEAGANLVLVDLEVEVLAEAEARVAAAGGQGAALAVRADVTDGDAASRARDAAFRRFGRIDVLVNDAAIGPQAVTDNFLVDRRKFWELDDALWKRMFEVNSFGPQLMTRTVVPGMIERGWGRIINVTTSLDTMFLAGAGAYGPSKAALEAHSRVMMQDLAETGVSANVLVPGGGHAHDPGDRGHGPREPDPARGHACPRRVARLRGVRRRQRHAFHRRALGRGPAAGRTNREGRRAGRLGADPIQGDLSRATPR